MMRITFPRKRVCIKPGAVHNVMYAECTDIYEHGIVVPDGELPPAGLTMLATTRLPIYSGYSLTLVDRNERSLNERALQILEVPGPHAVADFYEESDVRFFLRESLYHLNNVMDLYVRVCRIFEELHGYRDGPQSGNTGDSRVLFEVDAYLGAARRVYEAISKVLWKHYAPRGETGRWSSMRKAVAAIESGSTKVPARFATPLISSWNTYGVKLADYRNYVAHTGALAPNAVCWMSRFDGGRWGASVALPDHPEDKKRWPVSPEVAVDALEYCHDVAGHLAELCEGLTALPDVADYLAHPPGYGGRPKTSRGEVS